MSKCACSSVEPGKNQRHSRRRSSERPRLLADRELLCDEGEGNLSHITPPMVNDQGMSSIGDCAELGDGGVVLVPLVSSRGDRPRERIGLLARNEEEVG